MNPQVLLMVPPWRSPFSGSLSVATLKPILEGAGIDTDVCYGTVLYEGPNTHHGVGADNERLMNLGRYAMHVFAPALYPELAPETAIESLMRRVIEDRNLRGIRPVPLAYADLGRPGGAGWRQMRLEIDHAEQCIERCVAAVLARDYDVLGLSITFEGQLPAALAIARRAVAKRPGLRVAFGGPACFGEPATELVRSFPFVDAVCHSEGEDVIVPLVEALVRGEGLETVPGIAYRDASGVHRTLAPPLLFDLDRLPTPDYDAFIEQLAASPWSYQAPQIFFETSRGCWWGQKHLCTFCGLNADGLKYRHKSADRAVREIETLYHRYPSVPVMLAADNILEMDYIKSVLPRLAPLASRRERPLRMWYEIKSNLTRPQLEVLAAGGAHLLQPGIESFSDGVLKVMRKGATALGQVQLIKWVQELGLDVHHNVIMGNPGETKAHYDEMIDLIPYLLHLPPPASTLLMSLEQFSPYHSDPERHGISNVRPRRYYRELFPDPEVDVSKLAYRFDYDHPMWDDDALRDAHQAAYAAIAGWERDHPQTRLSWSRAGGGAVVQVRRPEGQQAYVVAGQAADVFEYFDRAHLPRAASRAIPGLDPELLQAQLDTLHHRRLLCRDGKGRYLNVVPQFGHAKTTPPVGQEVELNAAQPAC